MANTIRFPIFAHPALGFFTSGTCLGLQFCLLWAFAGRGVSSVIFFLGIFGLASACIPIAMKAFPVRLADLLIILLAGLLLGAALPLYLKPDSQFLELLALSVVMSGVGVFRAWSWHRSAKTTLVEKGK